VLHHKSYKGWYVGYHQTSFENWLSINSDGVLKPSIVVRHREQLERVGFPFPTFAIWVWKGRLDRMSEMANVLWHASTKRTKVVVVLKVKYKWEDLLKTKEECYVSLSHYIDFSDDMGFSENQQGTLLGKPISLDKIKLVKIYDLKKYISIKEKVNGDSSKNEEARRARESISTTSSTEDSV
jgi:hypothetical protein